MTIFLYIIILVLCISGPSISVYKTIRGNMIPNRITYFLWFFASMIAFSAQIAQGVTWTAVLTFLSGFMPFCVFVASFFQREKKVWKLTLFDWTCGLLALAGLVLWWITSIPNLAIVFALLADALSALPTLRKMIISPETEFSSAFIPGGIAALIILYLVPQFTFAYVAFPLYIVIINTTLFLTGYISLQLKK